MNTVEETKEMSGVTLPGDMVGLSGVMEAIDEAEVLLDNGEVSTDEKEEEKKEPLKLEQWEKEIEAEENMDLIHFVANKFRNTRLPYDDLYSVCMMGYTKALNAFDKNRGVKLSTFAVNCMQNEVKFYLRKEKKHTTNTVSMGTILSRDKNGNDFQLEDILSETANEKVLSIEDTYEKTEDKNIVEEAIESLTEQEQYIMRSRYGLRGHKPKTQKLIAEEIDMSQANVSKIQKNCIDKIKRYVESQYNDERIAF
ncbi:sigma-70 family RNA polymerase sigma factor [Rossellomorea marisflavi]|uniref:sigma-70 family RNA polymerase sigma factor n=1 Tax=Rossellomorea marisflavi TaxID=189381 RepID=UPI003FA076B4